MWDLEEDGEQIVASYLAEEMSVDRIYFFLFMLPMSIKVFVKENHVRSGQISSDIS